MQRLNHPERIQQPDIISYPYKTHDFDTYYHILEDTKQNMIWACSREGIALLDMNKPQEKWQKYTSLGHTRLDFCYCLLTDQNHNIWVGTMNYGIIPVNTNPTPFSRAQIDLNRAPFLLRFQFGVSYALMNNRSRYARSPSDLFENARFLFGVAPDRYPAFGTLAFAERLL